MDKDTMMMETCHASDTRIAEEIDKDMSDLAEQLLEDYKQDRDIDAIRMYELPEQKAIKEIIRELMMVLLPGYYREKSYRTYSVDKKILVILEDVMFMMTKQIEKALLHRPEFEDACIAIRQDEAKKIVKLFFKQIPKIREFLNTDIIATYEGDPAANSKDEIVLAYPGLYATAIYRLAHELHELDVPLIPRIMTEYAHRKTGVDIHPGATIGKYFCMDHATGVVIGSTSVIGEHVKVYQGVTIGALSTKAGQKLHGTKRHPTIEDNVTLYSGASVLGGDTVIGEGAVIGGNAFVTKSVDPHTTVTIKTLEMVYDKQSHKAGQEKERKQDEWFYVI